jgi:GNAT superfamily N-acetyltransferase
VSEQERALAFMRGIDERASTQVVPFGFGTAYLHPELPDAWSRNFAWIDGPVPGERLGELLAEVDRIHSGAGLRHRRMVFGDEDTGMAVAATLRPHGWQAPHTRLLVHDGTAPPAAANERVREVDPLALARPTLEFARAHPEVEDEQTAHQLLGAYGVVAGVIGERCFAALVDGSVVSYCRLYSDGATAQIEDVATLSKHRGRGYSSAVVRHAIAEAAGHELTFVLALEDDWPRQWYERLGFRPLGRIPELVKPG